MIIPKSKSLIYKPHIDFMHIFLYTSWFEIGFLLGVECAILAQVVMYTQRTSYYQKYVVSWNFRIKFAWFAIWAFIGVFWVFKFLSEHAAD